MAGNAKKSPAKQPVKSEKAASGGQLTIKDLLRNNKNTIAQSLENTPLTPERLLNVCMTEIRRTPKLRECSQASLLGSVIQSAQLGLEPGSALGHCYLIPFFNRKLGCLECQFMLGYRGMLALARRSGSIVSIDARVVYSADDFDLRYGTETRVIHKPRLTGDRGGVLGVYAVAHLQGGGSQVDYMTVEEVLKVRDSSKAKGDGPWQTHFEEMAKKTVVRRLFKYLDVSIEALTAVGLDERADAGLSQNNEAVLRDDDGGVVVDMDTGEIIDGAVSSAADLNKAL
ncbi:recombinase RecT [Endozoicomonas sp.]|uniref:recombinase RecT n=1 Tax=Endozoicomonas sp. TaxID=1892382 RepID=UPI0028848DA7|nr:recombinase RecT [Endozoicomonas sp.]